MMRLACLSALVVFAACAGPATRTPEFLPADAEVAGFTGLERLERTGAFERGVVEHFRAHFDTAAVARVEWSASAGALSQSGNDVSWSLPDDASATLSAKVLRRDGTEGALAWSLRLNPRVGTTTQSAQDALLATPMPVLDGGTLEISGGACDVKYEGTSTNVALAFTTETHPALMFGRWNGSTWTLEVVDAMGFNTGGVVWPHVQLQLSSGNQPHLVYVKDSQVWYATKVGGVWTRERVDSSSLPMATAFNGSTDDERSYPSLVLNASGVPTVLYVTGFYYSSSSPLKPVLSTRTGANAWTQTVALPSGVSTTINQMPTSDLLLDGANRFVFAVEGYTTTYNQYLVGWSGTSGAYVTLPVNLGVAPMDAVLVSGTRALFRTRSGLLDVNLNATFASSTVAFSSVESSITSFVGDIGWAGTRPVLLHQHGGSVEVVTTNASNFWTYTQYGTSSGVTSALAVHPSTGDISICYQANGRIIFQ